MPYKLTLVLTPKQAADVKYYTEQAVIAGRRAYEAGLGIQAENLVASASSPLTAFLNE